jgi:hypothetical protein
MFAAFTRLILPPAIVLLALMGVRFAVYSSQSPDWDWKQGKPHTIAPLYNWPEAVTNEQLVQVLNKVQPPTSMPLTNNLVHALRLWGPQAEFQSPKIPSGAAMLRYLLDDAEFQHWAGKKEAPLWSRNAFGIRPRNYEDNFNHSLTSSYHVDDLLATLAESGVSLHEKVQLRNGETATVRDILEHSLRAFYLKRFEYEWGMIAYARYAHPLESWKNQFGEKINTDALVNEMIGHRKDIGPCNGLHRLEAMVLLYRVDESVNALPPATKKKMLAYMLEVSQLLQASQNSAGFWSKKWIEGTAGQNDTKAQLSDKILVTGHQLEWLALAPEEVLPPRETIVRACQYLARTLPELPAQEIEAHYGPFSHAARALCLWRSADPYATWKNGATAK